MAKLEVLPHQAIISGFNGVIDFYVHDGLACARRWPRSPGHRRAPAVQAGWESFTYASKLWSLLSPEVQAAYNSQASDSGLSGRDLMARGFLSGIYTYPH